MLQHLEKQTLNNDPVRLQATSLVCRFQLLSKRALSLARQARPAVKSTQEHTNTWSLERRYGAKACHRNHHEKQKQAFKCLATMTSALQADLILTASRFHKVNTRHLLDTQFTSNAVMPCRKVLPIFMQGRGLNGAPQHRGRQWLQLI